MDGRRWKGETEMVRTAVALIRDLRVRWRAGLEIWDGREAQWSAIGRTERTWRKWWDGAAGGPTFGLQTGSMAAADGSATHRQLGQIKILVAYKGRYLSARFNNRLGREGKARLTSTNIMIIITTRRTQRTMACIRYMSTTRTATEPPRSIISSLPIVTLAQRPIGLTEINHARRVGHDGHSFKGGN